MAKANKRIEELLADDSFIRWIERNGSPGEHAEWQAWLKSDPARKKLVQEAKKIHYAIRFNPSGSPPAEDELVILNRTIDEYELGKESKSPLAVTVHTNRNYGRARVVLTAAVFLITFLSTALFFYQEPADSEGIEPVYSTTETTNGQKKVLTLSDGSVITLQANSTLKHPSKNLNETVEFWLQGEAYFNIKSQQGDSRRTYRIYTQDGLAEVMGTKFNVNTFKTGTEVVLEEGKLRIEIADSLSSAGVGIEHIMEPGEWNRFVYNGESIEKRFVAVEVYTSWTRDKLFFEHTPLKEIAERIRHIYGVDVVISDPKLQQVKISGSVPNDNLPVLLNALESMLERPLTNINGVIRI